MKINRYKKVNRILKFYANHFGFRKPYQVLLDGTICVAALKHKINIHEQLTKYLDGDAKLLTTPCIVKEVEKLGPYTSKALFVIKNFGQHDCLHYDQTIPASDCILDMIQNRNSRYIIATQDRELQKKCRNIVGVPLLYFHMRVPTLEAPSNTTQNAVHCTNDNNLEKKDISLSVEKKCDTFVKQKRKFKKGPNPLSCKKKKKHIKSNEKQNLRANDKKSKKIELTGVLGLKG